GVDLGRKCIKPRGRQARYRSGSAPSSGKRQYRFGGRGSQANSCCDVAARGSYTIRLHPGERIRRTPAETEGVRATRSTCAKALTPRQFDLRNSTVDFSRGTARSRPLPCRTPTESAPSSSGGRDLPEHVHRASEDSRGSSVHEAPWTGSDSDQQG